ncbi:hypothetical protein P5F67_02060 [Clostridium perfringens]|uniref:hypothetical protein n=2 Tax=Clostridium perfringens TaxID=1502 RepID=UPI001FB0AD64|nr:hypothetical protein [Clostridium perfringens]MDK0545580.1 hypothetical protein [Clostridium perfringens]MDK0606133.1 hypothetical protein [Clostridium perfringens]MDK0648312.1 hypothetical protein [Clostridium perfringens]MDK0839129.1 hypothetical protein [Clostridium perfringens]MDK0924365.1 hypothetical protein [Clostridium perfringens]
MNLYNTEREGQLDFFKRFMINYEESNVLIKNTDGVYNGNLFEFKLIISDINKVLFQAIKYLSKLRISGNNIPLNILLISLNEKICYVFNSKDYFQEIHIPYFGPASKNNEGFVMKNNYKKIDYSTQLGQSELIHKLKEKEFMPIEIDENCIVGWADRYYRENPKANKGDFLGYSEGLVNIIGEIREPKYFKGLILPYTKKTNEKFKYLMDKLNDSLNKKDLGAFYTPDLYCKKAAELLRLAIKRVPKGNDYIILDRCAGTGNLEAVLTEEELSHCILSTYEYYEYKVLCERLAHKVKEIIPPVEMEDTYDRGCVRCANALSKEYIENEVINQYIKNEKYTIILFENPPYAETNGTTKISSKWKENFVVKEMKKEVKGTAVNELSNAFIWSAFKYYLRQPTDSYIVFSPIKYWKVQHLINKEFIDGFAFNRKHFHTKTNACITVILWGNKENKNINKFYLKAYNILKKELLYDGEVSVKKVFSTFSDIYYDKTKYKEDIKGIAVKLNGIEIDLKVKNRVKALYNKNIIGYLVANTSGFDNPDLNSGMTIAGRYDGNGFYLRKDNYLEKLPMFAASRYVIYNSKWTERGRIMKSADGAEKYFKYIKTKSGKQMLLRVLLFCILEIHNHMRSFEGSDGNFYRNELSLDVTNGETIAIKELKKLNMRDKEKRLIELWNKILEESKKTSNYNPSLTYGLYQIKCELNTFHKNEKGEDIPDYLILDGFINSLKTIVKDYYLKEIVPFLFEYEFLK